jgi:hypothetical protein
VLSDEIGYLLDRAQAVNAEPTGSGSTPTPELSALVDRRFQIGVSPLSRPAAKALFDRFWIAKKFDRAALADDDPVAIEYDAERADYAACCDTLYRRQRHRHERHAIAASVSTGRPTPTVPASRPRETASRRQRSAVSRDGDSGDHPGTDAEGVGHLVGSEADPALAMKFMGEGGC